MHFCLLRPLPCSFHVHPSKFHFQSFGVRIVTSRQTYATIKLILMAAQSTHAFGLFLCVCYSLVSFLFFLYSAASNARTYRYPYQRHNGVKSMLSERMTSKERETNAKFSFTKTRVYGGVSLSLCKLRLSKCELAGVRRTCVSHFWTDWLPARASKHTATNIHVHRPFTSTRAEWDKNWWRKCKMMHKISRQRFRSTLRVQSNGTR